MNDAIIDEHKHFDMKCKCTPRMLNVHYILMFDALNQRFELCVVCPIIIKKINSMNIFLFIAIMRQSIPPLLFAFRSYLYLFPE